MGNFCLCQKEVRLILIGIDLAGKTTVMNQLRYKEARPTTPTVGFNFESIQYKNMVLNIWDTGGQYKIRDLWQHYYEQIHGILYVVDSTDEQRMQESKDELHKALRDDNLRNAFLCIIANKRDLEDECLSSNEMQMRLEVHRFPSDRRWKIFETSALKGSGLDELVHWICNQKLIE